ncbi:hypothetical protein [Terrabacter sp. C0L_2]|uniref:hypothetical protein n=1 Tax=Terrabacter sp. C0L_2 TaxID=3108389 RepID=UPI002ED4B938|nr:hypothetical protein U5C87_14155 [Terrabacter sp. C0L_2]
MPDEVQGTGGSPGLTAPPEKLSAFLARILEQLSLSAWLPAAYLTVSLAVMYELGRQADLDVGTAVVALTSDPVTLLVVTIPIVVLATLVTQSFSFEAIRALEGYWQRRWLLGWLHHGLIRCRTKHKNSLRTRFRSAREAAFASARGPMLLDQRPREVVDAIEADLLELKRDDLDAKSERIRANTAWRNYGDPVLVSKFDRLRVALLEYPEDGLVMPTKLGNVLRATESRLQNASGDVGTFAMRRRRFVDSRIQLQHDQFRTRLDMYCTLVFVAMALAAAWPALTWNVPHGFAAELALWLIAPVANLLLAFAAYRAAIASARGYCTILRVMDQSDQIAAN